MVNAQELNYEENFLRKEIIHNALELIRGSICGKGGILWKKKFLQNRN